MALRDWLTPATLATLATLRTDRPSTVATVATVARAEVAEQGPVSVATPEQAAELRALFAIVAADWPDVEQAEALALALSDPEAALTSFRESAREKQARVRFWQSGPYTSAPLAERDPTDDRRLCTDCANRTPQGRCLSAWRREGPGAAAREYYPISNLLRRCGCYAPRAHDPDQRPGAERWPCVADEVLQKRGAGHG